MAFDPLKYDIENWLRDENENLLQKVCNIYDGDGLLVEQYKTRIFIVPVGLPKRDGKISVAAPALWRSFNYDEEGNPIASIPEMKEWSQECEDNALGGGLDPGGPGGGTGGVPLGLKIAKSTYEYNEISAALGLVETTIQTLTVPLGETYYLRHISAGGCNIGKYVVYLNGAKLQQKYSYWCDFNQDFYFDTANGGVELVEEDVIQVKVTNLRTDPADYNSSIGYVKK